MTLKSNKICPEPEEEGSEQKFKIESTSAEEFTLLTENQSGSSSSRPTTPAAWETASVANQENTETNRKTISNLHKQLMELGSFSEVTEKEKRLTYGTIFLLFH